MKEILQDVAFGFAYWLRTQRAERLTSMGRDADGWCEGFFAGSAKQHRNLLRTFLPRTSKAFRRVVGENIRKTLHPEVAR